MELFETDIHANGIKLHIYWTNTNKPPLLSAHGRRQRTCPSTS